MDSYLTMGQERKKLWPSERYSSVNVSSEKNGLMESKPFMAM